ncbi:hypothetical protein CG398_00945 [Bifidobacteriaceae bacterium NR003]|nr:hypothetical protein CG398_00945 [Bifidobacteriaceae bacterium NR003]
MVFRYGNACFCFISALLMFNRPLNKLLLIRVCSLYAWGRVLKLSIFAYALAQLVHHFAKRGYYHVFLNMTVAWRIFSTILNIKRITVSAFSGIIEHSP